MKVVVDLGEWQAGVIGACYYRLVATVSPQGEVEELRWFAQVNGTQDVLLARGGGVALSNATVGGVNVGRKICGLVIK